ncbi:MAG: prepilin-type N-terminal cleavage/methylation domain-containing protein [Deltaproteobacteria bacterium]|nr:prepilin-type N-terminal cleavage/methylation domain-containing protein [Deltaproteobacteria bacterium]
MSPTGPKPRNRAEGFTLLELSITLLIVGLFVGLASPRIEGVFTGGDLALGARLLISEVSALRGKAASTRRDQILRLDLDRNWIYPMEPSDETQPGREPHPDEKDGFSQRRTLPTGVFLKDLVTESRGRVQEGEAEIRFHANGRVERALIHLGNEAGRFRTLEVRPLTGLVRIHDGYVDQKWS